MITRNIGGTIYTFDPSKSHVLKRGLFDVYEFNDKNEWVCLTDMHFWSHRLQEGIVIPAWFVTDFASIPKFARSIISVNERHRYAALPHDWLFCCGALGIDRPSRKVADQILRDFCEVLGVPAWKRNVMYAAVRACGWPTWDKKDKVVFCPHKHKKHYRRYFDVLNS